MSFLKEYLIAFIAFFSIDVCWLILTSKRIYTKSLAYIMSDHPNWGAAILFYLIYIAGIVFFVIDPAVTKGSLRYAIFAGLFFGLVSYATYDLTNLATIKAWPIKITVIDLIWGSSLCTLVSIISYQIMNRWK